MALPSIRRMLLNTTSSLLALADGTLPNTFEGLRSHVPIEWVRNALSGGRVGKVRNRKLSAEDVVWLTIGMALYRNQPMIEVVHRLDLVLPDTNGHPGLVTKGAIPQARERVGEGPLRALFQTTAQHWARESAERNRWRGLMVLGADGSMLRVPDSPENRKQFHLPCTGRSTSGYPQVRLAVLMALRSHLWLDFEFTDCHGGEGPVAWPLIQRAPNHSVTILDRYYVDYLQLQQLNASGENRHWLLRTRRNMVFKVIQRWGPHDVLVEVPIHRSVRREHPELPKTFLARRITYRRKGFRPRVLLSSLLDPHAYPAEEIAELYHERWELELGYDELKTDVLQQEEAIRSQTPDGVRQELWGMAIAYNLVRREMDLAARDLRLPPRRLSFVTSLRLIQELFLGAHLISPGAWPKRIRFMRVDLRRLVLPPRTLNRHYPRHVKIKMSGYLRNPKHPK